MTAISTIAAYTAALPLRNLSELLSRQVQRQPERTAVGTSDLETVISYSELDALVRSAIAQLSRLGMSRGTTIALVSDNCVEFVIGLLAGVSSGARVAPLSPALTLSELNTRLSELSAHAVLAPKHLASKLEFAEATAASAARWIMSVEGSRGVYEVRIANRNGQSPANGAAEEASAPIDGEDVALLMFTAGTTSAPKVVALTHRNVVASVHGISTGY